MISLFRQYLVFLLCALLLNPEVGSSGIKEALEEHLKDIAHNEESESVKLEKGKAEKDHQIDIQSKDSHSNKYEKENNESKFLKNDQESKLSSDKDAYRGYNSKQDKVEDNHSDGFKRGHKKGHHKQGFQNSYHKDESSNKSTYFDDFNDEGDQTGYKSKINKHDDQGGRSYEGSHNNGLEHSRKNYLVGAHNRYGDEGDKSMLHKDYGKNSYLDNSENYNKYRNGHGAYNRDKVHDRHEYRYPQVHHDPSWDWNNRKDWDRSGWERNPNWGRDYNGPGYYDNYGIRHDREYGYGPKHGYGYRYGESRSDPVAELPRDAPIVARRKQTITIYEDPRYTGQETNQLRREEGDYIQLDYQPSSSRYTRYDNTYYSGPANGAKSSKINRLVYNYRRQ